MARPLSTDPDVLRMKPMVLRLLEATPGAWMSYGEIDRLLPSSGHRESADVLLAICDLADEAKIEHLRRPSDGEDVYRALRPNPDADMSRRVSVLEAELQSALKRLADLEREVEHLTTPRSG
jgi:hypothetical protein